MGHKRPFGTIVEIGDILVSEDVILEYFACDYPVCKGKCCIVGDSGAPLKEEELDPIEVNYDAFAPLMRPEGRQAVDEKGFFEIDRDGDLVTPLVPGSEECAFCHVLRRQIDLPEAHLLPAVSHPRGAVAQRRARPEPPSLGHLQVRVREGAA